MTRIQTTFIAAVICVALSAGAVAQALGGTSDITAYEAQSDRAAHAALEVAKSGHVVSVAHDHEGVALWTVRIRSAGGHHAIVHLDRNFEPIQSRDGAHSPARDH